MQMDRRTFLAGSVAAGTMLIPSVKVNAAIRSDSYATLIDLTRCDGCEGLDQPLCVTACRKGNEERFPSPDPAQIKDYWPQKKHEDWTLKKHLNDRLTPYNWIFVQQLIVDGKKISIPRRCMHCDNPACAKLCPFGVMHKEDNGIVHIDTDLCFGGAKCRTVCPWSIPQRQAGVGIYTNFQSFIPAGGGVMYKCDLCRDRLSDNKSPYCIGSCPKHAMEIGQREQIFAKARKLKEQYGGFLYGLDENDGTSTVYVSSVDFARIDQAIVDENKQAQTRRDKMPARPRMHKPENMLNKHNLWAKLAVSSPLIGAAGAFLLAAKNRMREEEK